MLKRKEDVWQFASSTENSIRNSSPKAKRQKEDDQGKTSGDTDSESYNSCQNTIRKLIPLSRYKKLFKKPAKACRNQDGSGNCIQEKTPLQVNFEASIFMDVVEDGDMIRTNKGAKYDRGSCFATNGSLENKELKYTKLLDATLDATTSTLKQDHKAKFNGIMHGKMIHSLNSYNFPKPSGEEIDIHGPCTMKSEPPPSMLQVKKASFCKISKLPDGCPTEVDNDHLSSVNCIRGFWHKSLNAVLIDNQERISKSILFVLSLQSHACRPSLIITSDSLAQWHDNFLRLAPSANVIIYLGDDARKMIQRFEFYEESGGLMFQVLLADPKAIVNDLVDIARIKWESIIVDDCQNSVMIGYLKRLNTLSTDFKLLLLNGQLKDSLSDYLDLLAFLNPGETIDDSLVSLEANINEPPGALLRAKKKLASHIAYKCKFESSKFFEFWVPVPLSNVQLEQYCSTLVSNTTALRSNLRTDVVEVLHRILITAKKCCDHPYLVDGKLQDLVTKSLEGAEFLNAEVCASGKLYLLERILQELKSLGLRAVILFQSLGGSGNISLGDILNVFLQQRFGADAYECIESGLVIKKKVDALKKFNNKETGRFVLLIEKRACLSSVKLHSVDAIILFNSDWNPLTDIKSLQRLSITSQHSCIKLFRFYTPYTIEEKLLMLSKQGTHLESNVESISRNIIHSLLGWGASYLFQKLDQLHCSASSTLICEPSFDKLCLNDVILEILTQLPGENETSRAVPCSFLIKARSSGGKYTRNIVLNGEKEGMSVPDKDLPSFWSGLLEGKRPRWIYISESSQRVRKRIQNTNEIVLNAVEGDEVKNKRLKIKSQSVKPVVSKVFQEMEDPPKDTNKSSKLECDGREQKLNEQKDLLKLLKPELSELCDIFGLPESVKGVAQEFLGYIMNNHEVSIDQATVLQALKISLEIFTGECTRPVEVFASGNDRSMAFPHEFAVSVSDPVVTPSHCVEALGCNDAIRLAEHEQVRYPLAGYKGTSLQLHHSAEQNEVPIPQKAIASGIEFRSFNGRLLENVAHSLIPRLCTPSEGITIEGLRNTVNQPDEAGVHDATAAAVIESEPSIQQLPENTTLRPIFLQEHLASESTPSEHLRTSAIESDQQNLAFQNLPSTGWLPPQAVSADPLQNELLRVYKQQCSCDKNYEAKKWLIRSECEQEIAKIRMKYDTLLQDAERGYVLDQMIFQKIYQKVFWHKVFADEIRANIYDHKEGLFKSFQAPSQNSSQLLRTSWPPPSPQLISRPLSITPSLPSPTPNLVRQPAPHLCGFRPPQASLCESRCLAPAAVPPVHQLLPATLPSVESSISQPPVRVELLEFSGAGDLLESMLADLPATGDEFPTTGMMDSRPNTLPDIICLSDED